MPIGRDKRGDGFAVVGAIYLADTVDDIHRRIGMAQYRWSLYETGQSTPSVETYLKMSALLDASIDELMDTYPPIREEDTP